MIRIKLHIVSPKRYKNRYKIRDLIPTFLWALWTFYIILIVNVNCIKYMKMMQLNN